MGGAPSKQIQPFPAFTYPAVAFPPPSPEQASHVHIIANPKSGGGKGAATAAQVAERCRAAGMGVSTLYTRYGGHAREIAAGLSAHIHATTPSGPTTAPLSLSHILVAIGGDGTAHEVINGMCYASLHTGKPLLPLALVPCGTGNTLAMNLGINSADDSIQAILTREVHCIDLMECTHPDDTSVPRFSAPGTGATPSTAPTAAADTSAAGLGVAETAAGTTLDSVRLVDAAGATSGTPGGAEIDAATSTGKSIIERFQPRVIYSCNIFAWGLSTAVLQSANNLRNYSCNSGAQYNCAAYGALIANTTYLAAIDWVRPGAPVAVTRETFSATRAALPGVADGAAPEDALVPIQPVTGEPTPLVLIHFQVTCYMGARMAFCPFAKLDDGLMDICAVAAGSRMDLIGVMESAKDMGAHAIGTRGAAAPRAKPNVRYAQAEEVIFRPLPQEALEAWHRGEPTPTSTASAVAPAPDAGVARERKRFNVTQRAMIGAHSVNVDGELHGFSPARLKMLARVLPVFTRAR